MDIIAIDPGYRESATLTFDGREIVYHSIDANETVLAWLSNVKALDRVLVIEEMQMFTSSFGVGREVFDSVFWSGRFAQVWSPLPFERILRSKVRGHLGASKGGDAAVRAALIDRFGPYKETAIGSRKHPGPLFGIKSHEWSALALAVTYHDLQQQAVALV